MQFDGKGYVTPTGMEPDPGTLVEFSPQHDSAWSVKDLLGVLWRRLWVILLVAALFAGTAVAIDWAQTPIYEANIKLVIGQEQQGRRADAADVVTEVDGLQSLALTVVEVIQTRTVADAVIEELGLEDEMIADDILGGMRAQEAERTQVVNVSYRDPDPEMAQQIANTIGEVFSGQISEISPDANSLTATVWETAELPDSPVSPDPFRDSLVALVLGGMLGMGLAFLLEHLDDRWRSPEEAERISGIPTFGVIREFKASEVKKKEFAAPPPSNAPLEGSKPIQGSRRARRARKGGLISWLVSG